ncbi:hypothetical protein DFH06DRAFT_1372717 [Mycena polygramma]|nr:hypothetical protein DFH06DRAFT_1372717 [Mycena polygramma]
MGRMRLPSLLLHGIEGAFAGPGAKTVIPAKVGGKFSLSGSVIHKLRLGHRTERADSAVEACARGGTTQRSAPQAGCASAGLHWVPRSTRSPRARARRYSYLQCARPGWRREVEVEDTPHRSCNVASVRHPRPPRGETALVAPLSDAMLLRVCNSNGQLFASRFMGRADTADPLALLPAVWAFAYVLLRAGAPEERGASAAAPQRTTYLLTAAVGNGQRAQPGDAVSEDRALFGWGRLVPPQTPDNVEPLVVSYLEREFAKLGSKNTLEIELLPGSGMPWVADWKHWNYAAATRATEAVYKQTPDLMREGGSIPVTLTFAETLGVNVLLLPLGREDDGAQ